MLSWTQGSNHPWAFYCAGLSSRKDACVRLRVDSCEVDVVLPSPLTVIDAVRVVLANEAEVNQISFWSHSQDLFSLISQPPSAGNSCQRCSAHCMPTLPRRFAVSSICLVCAQRRNSNYCPPSILQMRLITHISERIQSSFCSPDGQTKGLVQKLARLWRGLRRKSLERGSHFFAFRVCFLSML